MNDIPQPVNTQPVNNNVLSGDVQDETSVITASTVLTEIYSHQDHLIFREPSTEM